MKTHITKSTTILLKKLYDQNKDPSVSLPFIGDPPKWHYQVLFDYDLYMSALDTKAAKEDFVKTVTEDNDFKEYMLALIDEAISEYYPAGSEVVNNIRGHFNTIDSRLGILEKRLKK